MLCAKALTLVMLDKLTYFIYIYKISLKSLFGAFSFTVLCFNQRSLLDISSVAQSCLILCNPMDCCTPGFPVYHPLLELAQTHVHQAGDAVQPSYPLLSPSPAFNLSQHQDLFWGVSSLHQVAKVLGLQHQSFQWIFRTDFPLGLTGLISL